LILGIDVFILSNPEQSRKNRARIAQEILIPKCYIYVIFKHNILARRFWRHIQYGIYGKFKMMIGRAHALYF